MLEMFCHFFLASGTLSKMNGMLEFSPGQVELCVDVVLHASVSAALPRHPELENVHFAATLQRLVARVPADVIVFVLLEQVTRVRAVGTHQQTLVLDENDGALLRRSHQLVWIPGHRVGSETKDTIF